MGRPLLDYPKGVVRVVRRQLEDMRKRIKGSNWDHVNPEGFLDRLQQDDIRNFINGQIREEHAAKPLTSVLEVGFGACYEYPKMADWYQQNGIKYAGVDFTQHFVDRAQAMYPDVSWAQGDVRGLGGIADQSFDVVYLYHVLEHLSGGLPDVQKAIRELTRISRRAVYIIWFKAPTLVQKTKGIWDGPTHAHVYKYSATDIWNAVLKTDFVVKYIRYENPWKNTVWKLEKNLGTHIR